MGIICNHCRTRNIRGVRYKCTYCVDMDLCESCFASDADGAARRVARRAALTDVG
jgi:hypothetical protein